MTQMNMDDPAKQEQIRRGHHEYLPTAGKHGTYVPRVYDRSKNEYPKMMGKWPQPQFQNFRRQNGVEIPNDQALQMFQAAMTEWDRAMTSSVVNNKAEEVQWLKQNAD